MRGSDCGWWGAATHEIELVKSCGDSLQAVDFKKALESSDPATLLGVARFFFTGSLSRKFPEEETGPLTARLMTIVAQHDQGGNGSRIWPRFADFSGPEIATFLEKIALGHLQLNSLMPGLAQTVSFPHLACLALARTNSPQFEKCLERVEAMKPEQPDDELALILTRAIRDEQVRVPKTIFESASTTLCLEALSILEKRRSKQALDLIITHGTTHDWAAIREESVLTVERMTGKSWFQNGENERAEWNAKEIRDWWSQNKTTFKFPAE